VHGASDGRGAPAGRARVAVVAVAFCLVGAALQAVTAPGAMAGPSSPGAVAPAPLPPAMGAGSRITKIGEGIAKPGGITTGPDGNLWFTNGWGALGRSTPSGALTFFPTGDLRPRRIVTGSDGNLWFTTASAFIGRMTTAGVLTAFPATGPSDDITAGPDGALWFIAGGYVSRMTIDGTVTGYPSGPNNERITAGPDGNVWTTTTDISVKRLVPNGAATAFSVPVSYGLTDLAAGADGNVWFTSHYSQKVGKVTPTGVVTTYTAPFIGYPGEITAGADGNMWFANDGGFRFMGRITPAGAINVTSYVGGDKGANLTGMTKGPDGKVWFLTSRSGLGTITSAGVTTMLPGSDITTPTAIIRGPDDAVWFANAASIGRVGPDRVVTVFRDPGITAPASLAVGPDGNIWFVNTRTSIGRLTPAGVVTLFTHPDAAPDQITLGPDGNLWFTDNGPGLASGLGRITPDGTITLFPAPGAQLLASIVAGPDGNLWFFGNYSPDTYRMTPAGVFTKFAQPPTGGVFGVAVGTDGTIWLGGSVLRRLSMSGEVTVVESPGLQPWAVAAGSDGNLWMSDRFRSIGYLAPSGHLTILSDPTVEEPDSLVAGSDGAMWFTNRGSSSIGRVDTTPGRPAQVAAVAGKQRATVTWTVPPPTSAPVTSATVTASPGGATCTWTAGPPTCTVSGLTVGIAYTFTVTSTNAWGESDPSLVSNTVIPWDGSVYHPLTPARILDSRTPTGSWASPLAAGTARELQVTGLGGASEVPASAVAVVMNVTATGSTANSFVTAWPAGAGQPTASNLNFGVGQTIPNLVTVKLGTGGKVSFATAAGAVDLVADVVGFYDEGEAGSLFNGITPVRLLDSRTGNGGWDGPLAAGTPRDLAVRQPGRATGVPATATAVIANVTVTEGTADSFLSVWPSGVAQPAVSNLNFATGQTVPNLAIVKIGDNGAIRLANAVGSAHVVVDVVGYFDPSVGARFHPIDPTRVLDDRIGLGVTGSWGPGETRVLAVAGVAGTKVPVVATDVVANVTATGATAGTFITVFPHGVVRPNSSNLNVGAGQTIPNLVTVKVGTLGSVDLFNAAGAVDLIADVVGYYAAT